MHYIKTMEKMEKPPVAVIVNFCSNESRFIGPCLEQCLLFARQVIVPVCDHFFDGTKENREILNLIYQAYPECQFIEYPFIPEEIPRKIFKEVSPAHFWHSFSRLIGASFLDPSIESVLFLDADEIPEGLRFREWLEVSNYHHHSVMKMANYWYFREPIYQALVWEDSAVLLQVRALDPNLLLHQEERDALYDLLPGPKRRKVAGCDGRPMIHHYSWVRTKDEMLKKVKSWGHKGDRNWIELVENEFSQDFKGSDFIHGYRYQTVSSIFNIQLSAPTYQISNQKAKLIQLSKKDVLKFLRFKNKSIIEFLFEFFGLSG